MTTRSRRTYDHRVKEQIIRTRNPDLFPELGIPRSTALSWIRRGLGEVVSFDDDREKGAVLRDRITEHNTVLPHSAFHGQTPDEKYFGKGDAVPGEFAAQRQDARRRHLERNQQVACSACPRSSLLPKEDVAA